MEALEIGGEGEKKIVCERKEFKLMLRSKLLSAPRHRRRKEHLFMIKRAEDQEGKHRRGQASSPRGVKALRRNRRQEERQSWES